MTIEQKLAEMGITLPVAPKPVAAYVPAVKSGNLIFISGQVPVVDGKLEHKGLAGKDVSLEKAQEAARLAAINCLAVLKSMANLDDVVRIVKLTGFVASPADFNDQPKVINGASELLKEVFGAKGEHARAAVGVAALPLGAVVEVEMIVEV